MEENKTITDGLIDKFETVQIGETPYKIAQFKLAKTLAVTQVLSEIAEESGIKAVEGEGSIFAKLLTVLPTIIRKATPKIYTLIGLIVVTNPKIKELRKAEEDLFDYCYNLGLDIADEAELAELGTLITVGFKQLNIDSVIKAIAPLLPQPVAKSE